MKSTEVSLPVAKCTDMQQTLEQFVREHDDRLHGHLGDLGYDTIEILEDYQKRDFQPISRRRYVLKNWLRDLIPVSINSLVGMTMTPENENNMQSPRP